MTLNHILPAKPNRHHRALPAKPIATTGLPQSPADETAVPTLATLVTRFRNLQEEEERRWRSDYNKLLDYLRHDERAEFILNQLLLRGIQRDFELEKELEERQLKLFSAQPTESNAFKTDLAACMMEIYSISTTLYCHLNM